MFSAETRRNTIIAVGVAGEIACFGNRSSGGNNRSRSVDDCEDRLAEHQEVYSICRTNLYANAIGSQDTKIACSAKIILAGDSGKTENTHSY